MKIKPFLQIVLVLFLISTPIVNAQSPETITEKQRDTLLYMTSRENPNYDICLVVDISGSMKGTLEKLKSRAVLLLDYVKNGDNLIFIRFDDYTRVPLIQEVGSQRDIDEFRHWIEKTEPTADRFGTDIEAAYHKTLETLIGLNDVRKKKGEPLRIQHVVFISDGDDIPAAHSPYRNRGSKESLEMLDLIKQAEKLQFIQILPVGMEFKGYVPQTTRLDPDKIKTTSKIEDPELQKFLDQLKEALKRNPSATMGSDTETVPKADYQFFIDWLSDHIKINRGSLGDGEEKHSKIFKFRVKSDLTTVKLSDLSVNAKFTQNKGKLPGEITEVKIEPKYLEPGQSANITVTVLFPQNWSLEKDTVSGNLEVRVTGNMQVETEGPSHSPGAFPTALPGSTPAPASSPSTGKTLYTFPFNPLDCNYPLSFQIATEKLVFLILSLIASAIILFPAAYIYQILVPITVTIKLGEKARVFKIGHKERITIGGLADFEVPGCSQVVAELQRRFRRFVLEEKIDGAIPPASNPKQGKILLRLGEGFSLVIDGSYKEFEFLHGNHEFADEEAMDDHVITDEDLDEGPDEFKF